MSDYVARAVTVIDFSDPRNIQLPEIYQVQSCVIKLEHGSIDIGSNCFIDRKVNKKGVATKVIKNSQGIGVMCVTLDSFDEDRVVLLQKLVRYAAQVASSLSQKTLEGSVKNILAFFRFYWAQPDLNYFQPENQVHFKEASKRYSANLRANKTISTSFKHQRSRVVFEFAEFLFDGDSIDAFDYDIIRNDNRKEKGTTPLLPENLDLALSLRSAIFESVADLVINKKTLPYPLIVPAVCKELNDTVWLGYSPWRGNCRFPRATDFRKYKPKEWFNREKGELLKKEQFHEQGCVGWNAVKHGLKVKNLDHSRTKQFLVEFAGLCFLDLLLSMTGMNQQPALDLPWFGGHFSLRAKQGAKNIFLVSSDDQSELECAKEPNAYLRSIKNRKGYQPVEVLVSNRLLPKFNKYMQLREYYLNGESDARLFPFSTTQINDRRTHLHKVFPEVPKLGTRQARASVSDSILTEVNDHEVAALVLQNDVKTVIDCYAAGTRRAHIEGVGAFLNSLDQRIRLTRNETKNAIETGVGSCDQGGVHPVPLPDAPFELDCSQQEGCFFCEHYSVHADDIDIRKLFSVLYYVNKGATRASNISYFNEIFGAVIERINELLEKIENISLEKKKLVSRIKEEVFVNEELDEFWLYKLNRLEYITGDR